MRDMVHQKAPVLSHWCIWHVGTTEDHEDTIYSPCDECGSQSNHRMTSSFPPGHWQTLVALRPYCPQLNTIKRGSPTWCRCGDPGAALHWKDWKQASGRPSHSWIRAVEADLSQQKIGRASAWRKASYSWRLAAHCGHSSAPVEYAIKEEERIPFDL